jgi:hypothetical protein
MQKWNEVTFDDAVRTNGERDRIVDLLQDRYSFVRRRAELEADLFLQEFYCRMDTATSNRASRAA